MNEGVPSRSWVPLLQDLARALPGLVTDRLELLALELDRAGRSITQIMLLALLATILGVTAWVALCGAVALALVALGMSWPLATLAISVVNLLLAGTVLVRIGRLTAMVGLPATRRHLAFFVDVKPAADPYLAGQALVAPPEGRP